MTNVVNLKYSSYDVYIGRSRNGESPGKWGNPARIGHPPPTWLMQYLSRKTETHCLRNSRALSRVDAVLLYHALTEVRLERGELSRADFQELYGRTLGCFCKPKLCHGDVLVEMTERMLGR